MKSDSLLIKNLLLVDEHTVADKPVDIWIEDGRIDKIAETSEDTTPFDGVTVNAEKKKLYASPGWVDLRASFGEPGEEFKETFESGSAVAASGGFSNVFLLPNTQPVVDTKAAVKAIQNFSSKYPVQLHPIAAVTCQAKGEQLTEMLDLQQAGTQLFSDGVNPVSNPATVVKILQYLQKFGGLFINMAEEGRLSNGGQMHEGLISTQLGMKGIPALAEVMAIKRDIDLLRYAGGKLHFSGISTAKGVELIKAAKEEGLQVTADVYAHNLIFTDAHLTSFNTNLKLNPPLRSDADRKALIKGLMDETIDIVVSDHRPQDTESKRLEFDLASPGAIGLQTMLPTLIAAGLTLPVIVKKLAITTRKIANLPEVKIEEGKVAELTVFDPDMNWTLNKQSSKSKSQNSPLWGQSLKGKVVGVLAHNKISLDGSLN